jgi:hypothetical protein
MKISINTPSYMKPDLVGVLKYLPQTRLFVCESEVEKYKKYHPKANYVVMEKGVQGNIARVRNYIIDHEFKRGMDAAVMIDDDVKFIAYFERVKRIRIKGKDFEAWVQKYSLLAKDLGVKLWGVNLNSDKQCYQEYTPFSFVSVVLGPFMVHLKNDLRYDERFFLKDDYDISLQHLNRYRRVLRLNKFYYIANLAGSGNGQKGGTSNVRTVKKEMEQIELLQKKWGESIVRIDKTKRNHMMKKKQTFDVNPIVRVPIGGV